LSPDCVSELVTVSVAWVARVSPSQLMDTGYEPGVVEELTTASANSPPSAAGASLTVETKALEVTVPETACPQESVRMSTSPPGETADGVSVTSPWPGNAAAAGPDSAISAAAAPAAYNGIRTEPMAEYLQSSGLTSSPGSSKVRRMACHRTR
jgi:hypothetical protein